MTARGAFGQKNLHQPHRFRFNSPAGQRRAGLRLSFFFRLPWRADDLPPAFCGERLDPKYVMAAGCAGTIVLIGATAFARSPVAALGAAVAVGLACSSLWPTLLAVTADRHPAAGAILYWILAAGGNAGGICMPWLIGVMADRFNLHWGLATSAVGPNLLLPSIVVLRGRR